MLKHSPDIVLIEQAFDADYYAYEYPDVALLGATALSHFLSVGWKEGRNPNPFFDMASYTLTHHDLADDDSNPFGKHLRYGMDEGRAVVPAASPSARTQLLFGYEVVDWVERIRPIFDADYYRDQGDVAGVDPVAHFAYLGWRMGRSPSHQFSLRTWHARNKSLARFLVNPCIVAQEIEAKRFDDRTLRAKELTKTIRAKQSLVALSKPEPAVNAEKALLRAAFSEKYYLATYRDIAAAKTDPFEHYVLQGWREGRNPNDNFDTSYYARANPDVARDGVHPLLHYLTIGRAAGRPPRAPGGPMRSVIEAAVPPELRARGYIDTASDPRLSQQQILAALRAAATNAGLVVACSHDCYVRSIGGTQIFISDEEAAFRQNGMNYLHISPREPTLHMRADGEDAAFEARLVFNGEVLGVATLPALRAALRLARAPMVTRHFIVHSILGFSVTALHALRDSTGAARPYIWLHDYATLCLGFNLLRNNVSFCHAPPSDSMACRVCVYGETRAAHLAAMGRLFDGGGFVVVAPSEVALRTWQAAARFPIAASIVHPHMQLQPGGPRVLSRKPGPIRIGFLGQPVAAKGWSDYVSLLQRFADDRRLQFFHFVSHGCTPIEGVTAVDTAVTRNDRDAAVIQLQAHAIDYVAVLSNWPETFSYVAHEVIAAGVGLLCLTESGNVRAVAERSGCGHIFEDVEGLGNFLAGDNARAFLKQMRQRPRFLLANTGTTATLVELAQTRMAAE